MRVHTKLLAVSAALVLAAGAARADTFGFNAVTANSLVDVAIGESQLFVDVAVVDGSAVFTFTNTGPDASSITDVYFYDAGLLDATSASILEGSGVDFEPIAKPASLPSLPSSVTSPLVFSADSESPVSHNGVNPGETLTIQFALIEGVDLADILAALNDGTFVIGIHVQAFADGESESFVTNVPEPCTLALVGLGGLLGLGIPALRRRRR